MKKICSIVKKIIIYLIAVIIITTGIFIITHSPREGTISQFISDRRGLLAVIGEGIGGGLLPALASIPFMKGMKDWFKQIHFLELFFIWTQVHILMTRILGGAAIMIMVKLILFIFLIGLFAWLVSVQKMARK